MNALMAHDKGWWEAIRPLAGLTVQRTQGLYDAARRGCSPMLHLVYDAIEAADPVVMTCVERRSSALAGLGWRATARAGTDKTLADEQRAMIAELADGIGDLAEAIEHLDLAFFRGFSHVQPIWEGGKVRSVARLDSWNFMRRPDGTWLWNPDCRETEDGLEAIGPEARLVTVRRPRTIDYPAMAIHVRKALGERDWGRFVERFGIPPVNVVMAPGTNEEQRADYVKSTKDAQDGRCTAWPSGSAVSYAEGARGQDPFTKFVEHQERLVVLMATGGTLTSLAQADTGSLAGGAQMDVWEQIVRRDAEIVGAALDRALFRPALEAAFPGRPVAAVFELGREASPSTDEVFETAAKARAAGYRVEQRELEEASGYALERDAEAAPSAPWAMQNSSPAPAMPLQSPATPLQNARAPLGGTTVPPGAPNASTGLLRAFAADTGPAAERLAALLAKADAGEDIAVEARKLAGELPELMRGEPAMAAVMGEELAKAVAEGLAKKGGAE